MFVLFTAHTLTFTWRERGGSCSTIPRDTKHRGPLVGVNFFDGIARTGLLMLLHCVLLISNPTSSMFIPTLDQRPV